MIFDFGLAPVAGLFCSRRPVRTVLSASTTFRQSAAVFFPMNYPEGCGSCDPRYQCLNCVCSAPSRRWIKRFRNTLIDGNYLSAGVSNRQPCRITLLKNLCLFLSEERESNPRSRLSPPLRSILGLRGCRPPMIQPNCLYEKTT